MSGRFEGQCWGCGGYGHRRAECATVRGGTGSANDSAYRQPPAYGGRGLFNEPPDPFAGFGGGFANQQQPQQQQPQQMAPGILDVMSLGTGGSGLDMGVQVNPTAQSAGEGLIAYGLARRQKNPGILYVPDQAARQAAAFLNSRAESKLRLQDPKSNRYVDIGTIPVLGRHGRVSTDGEARPQGQAGRGVLPGARDAQPNRAGAGLLGRHRVEKPGESRVKGARSVHTDHPPGFGCTICHGADHTAAGCAKPSKAGDNSFCPYHQTVSGVEQHADSKCHTSVDRCFDEVVGDDGWPLACADIDRFVTDFVRANRGARPEPRCENSHNHWAMCVARHIEANGLDGINAQQLPVRRTEVFRRASRKELLWQQFSHRDLAGSCFRFRDLHWECDTEEQLVEKLKKYAEVGLYKTKSARPKGNQPREDVEMADVQTNADAENASAATETRPASPSPPPSDVSGSYAISDRGDDSDSDEVQRLSRAWNEHNTGDDDLDCFPDSG